MSDIATRLRQCAADIRRTPVRLDTWIPLQQEAADTIDALRARVSELEAAGRAVLNCNDQVCAMLEHVLADDHDF